MFFGMFRNGSELAGGMFRNGSEHAKSTATNTHDVLIVVLHLRRLELMLSDALGDMMIEVERQHWHCAHAALWWVDAYRGF